MIDSELLVYKYRLKKRASCDLLLSRCYLWIAGFFAMPAMPFFSRRGAGDAEFFRFWASRSPLIAPLLRCDARLPLLRQCTCETRCRLLRMPALILRATREHSRLSGTSNAASCRSGIAFFSRWGAGDAEFYWFLGLPLVTPLLRCDAPVAAPAAMHQLNEMPLDLNARTDTEGSPAPRENGDLRHCDRIVTTLRHCLFFSRWGAGDAEFCGFWLCAWQCKQKPSVHFFEPLR